MAGKDERAERLKAQLRANLKRRKVPQAQAQAQAQADAPPEPDQRRTAIDPMSTAADAAD